MAEEKKTKPITLKEFKMWLQGVEEMQADGWVPDARQWTRIREKIDQILEEETPPAMHYAPGVRRAAPGGEVALPPGSELVFQPMNTSPPPASGAAAAAPSALNTAPAASSPRSPRVTSTPSGVPVTLARDSQVPVKTPDIDTSNGKEYNSNFV